MRFNQTLAIISLILLVSLSFSQNTNLISNICPNQLAETLLQSGTNVLNNPRTSNQRSLSFLVNVNYNIPAQGLSIAVSTGLIQAYNQGLGTDYSIRAVRVNQTNTVKILLYINSDRSWTSIKASYLISSRPDFFVGSFVTQSFDLLRSSGDSYLVQNQLQNWSFTNRRMKYIYLISGIKTADSLFNINLSEANFDNQKGKITVRVISNAIPNIQLLYITYVVFQQQAPFTLQVYNPLLNSVRTDYSLQGVNLIRGNAITYQALGLVSTQPQVSNLNCIGTACQNRCISSTDCSINRGFISQGNCYLCGINQFYSNNQCLPVCGQNQILNNNICICKTGYSLIYGNCCLTGFQYNSWGNCVQINSFCRANQQLVNGICVCNGGFTLVNGNCQRNISCNKPNQINVNNRCQCITGFQYNNFGNCVQIPTVCRINEQLINGLCVCLSGFTKNSFGTCFPIQCPSNQILSNGNCICFSGFVRNAQGICVSTSQCRVNQIYDQSRRTCVCRQGNGLNSTTGFCEICPPNSRSSGLLSGCLCNSGFTWSSVLQRCVNVVCSTNFIVNSNGVCVCANGFYLQNSQCKPIPSCPSRSRWNASSLSCVCDSTSQNLINNICQGCQVNSGWNGTQCACRSGYFLINGVCTQCSTNSDYIRGNCVCKFSYFGNGINCSPCDSTCGTCSSQFSNACLTCSNASYILSNGVCTLGLCDKGNFFNNAISKCDKCLQYCDACSSKLTCNTCISGFTRQTTFIVGSQIDACVQTCGDGKRFYIQCDDGNKANGDGCNANCQVQNGWTCVGGSSTTRSSCSNTIPTSSRFIIGGHVILQGQVLQGLSMTYLPPSLTNNGCPQCDQIFNVSIISSPIIPSVTVDYIQATQYRFVVRFNFQGSLANFAFTYSIRINQRFRQYFTTQDMQQIKTVKIDMALLAKFQQVTTLSLDGQSVTLPSASGRGVSQTISIEGVSSNAIKILFPQ